MTLILVYYFRNCIKINIDNLTIGLVMKLESQKLLSFDESCSFIFSHSALKEGWNSPNIFFITTLNDTKSQMRKRQILGRGMRLSVNDQGVRVRDKEIDRLTVIANESFEEFAKGLQAEYNASGITDGPTPNNTRAKKKAILKKDWLELNPEFKELWKKISKKTVFELNLDSAEYKKSVIRRLNNIEVRERKVVKQFGSLDAQLSGSVEDERNSKLNFSETLPNIVNHLEIEIGISRKTIIEILKNVDLKQFIKNSDEYLKKAVEIFDDEKHEVLVKFDGISYKENGEFYEFSAVFPEEVEGQIQDELSFFLNCFPLTVSQSLLLCQKKYDYYHV